MSETTGDHAQEHEPQPYWLTEYPEPGLERSWSQVRRPYTSEADDRSRIAAAIKGVRWHRLSDQVPFSPGLILRELIPAARQAGLAPLAMGVGTDPLDYPEPHLLDQPRDELGPDFFEAGYLVALRQLAGRTIFSAYFLVLGDEAGQVVFDTDDRPRPEVPMTRGCAAGLHELCRGALDDRRCACPCGCAAQVGTSRI
ncbi:hypothetical protein [Glycomyces tenuis]|uniref:hypothetical protein n=1 Tax=Glycomyces tenuis TaxID=58116 RepID=UPI000429228C|nr:hypothetical protein [Glycomyces tenuis]